jgi:hypothetical protein
MSYSLSIQNGDLVLLGNSLGIVYGANKLQQDMICWLCESYGIDPMHPTYGSLLEGWIGSIITPSTQNQVQSEVLRVLQNYQNVQFQALQQAPANFSLSEILYAIHAINVSISYDTVTVAITISNAQMQPSTVFASASTGAGNANSVSTGSSLPNFS